MKKCPTCQKTFDDNMRFCQTDGTPLVGAGEPADPFATMVAGKDEIAASIPPLKTQDENLLSKDDDLLDIPGSSEDPMKTSVVTDAEMKEMAIGEDSTEESAPEPFDPDATFMMDTKPKLSDISDEPSSIPKFDEPSLNPPKFGSSPPPEKSSGKEAAGNDPPNSPIPSPFGEKMPPRYQTPSNSPFQDPKPPQKEPLSPFDKPSNPFGQPPSANLEPKNQPIVQTDWTPPASPAGNFGEPASGQNPPVSASVESGQNKTLAIVSLVLGIVSIPCCGLILPGIAAVVTGFLAKSKADNNPNEYGGRTLALAGLGIGAFTTIIGIITNLLALLGYIPIPTFP